MSWNTPRTWTTNEVVTSQLLNEQLRDNMSGLLPIGTLILRAAPYATGEVAVEARWLQANGAAVSRTTYASLFAYLNSLSPALPFGTGDGVTTFNLPDMRGRIPVAEGEHGSVDSMGITDGTAVANRRPQHQHTPHTHNVAITSNGDFAEGAATSGAGGSKNRLLYSATADVSRLEVSTDGSDGGTGFSTDPTNTPAYLVVGSYFIKFTN